jgi:hypothetical protein
VCINTYQEGTLLHLYEIVMQHDERVHYADIYILAHFMFKRNECEELLH